MSLNAAKNDLRRQVLNARALHVQEVDCAEQFTAALIDLTEDDSTIACYLSFGDEPETRTFVEVAHAAGKRVLLPVANQDGSMTWIAYNGETEPGIFGFDEPKGKPAKLAEASIIVVPALAVDEAGHRLGRGKGFYDRALADANEDAPIIALVHDGEVVGEVPTEPHDLDIDGHIVCER